MKFEKGDYVEYTDIYIRELVQERIPADIVAAERKVGLVICGNGTSMHVKVIWVNYDDITGSAVLPHIDNLQLSQKNLKSVTEKRR